MTTFGSRPKISDLGFRTSDFQKIGRGLRDPGNVVKGKIFRDDRAPAVRAEFDLAHGDNLWKKLKNLKLKSRNRERGNQGRLKASMVVRMGMRDENKHIAAPGDGRAPVQGLTN